MSQHGNVSKIGNNVKVFKYINLLCRGARSIPVYSVRKVMGIDSCLVVGYGILAQSHGNNDEGSESDFIDNISKYLDSSTRQDNRWCFDDPSEKGGNWRLIVDELGGFDGSYKVFVVHNKTIISGSLKTGGEGGYGMRFDASLEKLDSVALAEAGEIYRLLENYGSEKPSYCVYHYFS